MVTMFVCESYSEYLHSIEARHVFAVFLDILTFYIANIFLLGENRKIFHEQECEKTLITLLASEVRLLLCSQTLVRIGMLLKTQRRYVFSARTGSCIH